MGLFGSLFGGNIDERVKQARETENSVIIDVRSPSEFTKGHIKGAINIPLDNVSNLSAQIADKTTPVFLYCASGARSAGAARILQADGYTNVTNMGGIMGYRGEIEQGA